MFALFENKERREADRAEIVNLLSKYGGEARDIVRQRARDKDLRARDRDHWKRIARKMWLGG